MLYIFLNSSVSNPKASKTSPHTPSTLFISKTLHTTSVVGQILLKNVTRLA